MENINLSLNQGEVNLVWSALNNANILGKDAPVMTILLGKIQQAVAATQEQPAAEAAPIEEPVIEEKKEEK